MGPDPGQDQLLGVPGLLARGCEFLALQPPCLSIGHSIPLGEQISRWILWSALAFLRAESSGLGGRRRLSLSGTGPHAEWRLQNQRSCQRQRWGEKEVSWAGGQGASLYGTQGHPDEDEKDEERRLSSTPLMNYLPNVRG